MAILIYLTNDPHLHIQVVDPPLLQENAILNVLVVKILNTQLCSQNKFPDIDFFGVRLCIFNTVDLYAVFSLR